MDVHTPTLFCIDKPHYRGPREKFYEYLIENPLGDQLCEAPITDVIAWCKWSSGVIRPYIQQIDSRSVVDALQSALLWGASSGRTVPGSQFLMKIIDVLKLGESRYSALADKALELIVEKNTAIQFLGQCLPEELDVSFVQEKLRAADGELVEIDKALFQLANEVSTPNPQKLLFILFLRCVFALARLSVRIKIDGKVTHAILRECWQIGLFLEYDHKMRLNNLRILKTYFEETITSDGLRDEKLEYRFHSILPPSINYLGVIKVQRISKSIISDITHEKMDDEMVKSRIKQNIREWSRFYRVSNKIPEIYKFLIGSMKEIQERQCKKTKICASKTLDGLPFIKGLTKYDNPDALHSESDYYWMGATSHRDETEILNHESSIKKELNLMAKIYYMPKYTDFRSQMVSRVSGFLISLILTLFLANYYVTVSDYQIKEGTVFEPLWWLIAVVSLLMSSLVCRCIVRFVGDSLTFSLAILFVMLAAVACAFVFEFYPAL